jgi:cytochrome c-type biogenesis protein CcsB
LLIWLAYALQWIALLAYLVHAKSNYRRAGPAGTVFASLGWCVLTAGLVQRGLASGHWPLTNRYEVALIFTWSIVGIYLLLEVSWHERGAGVFVMAIAILLATYALTRPADEQTVYPLLPVLRSVWLQVHVLSSLIGYGAFGVAAGLGVMQLLDRPLGGSEGNVQLPSKERTERTMERVVALGFPWLSLGILTGAIWAQNAWGRYWGWDPKETWSLITWLWYLLILHVRSLRSWRGRRLAGLVVLGFGVVLFTYIGVPSLVRIIRLESLHGF